jgi:predicted MFS family arabinose efflux permease
VSGASDIAKPHYLGELLTHWRPLLAAMIGLGSGYSTTGYITSIMVPELLKEFGWSKAEFALIGVLGLLSTPLFPVVGRLADVIGVRRTALIGIIAGPLAFLAMTRLTGDIRAYIAIYIFLGTFFIATTATVYCRVVVQYVERSRGLALALVASGPALSGAILAPMLNQYVQASGWRAGYVAVAVFTAVAGALALLMLPPEKKRDGPAPPKRRTVRADYTEIVRMRAFWVLGGAMLLCNLPQVIALTQLNLVLIEQGVTPGGISAMISAFAIGVLCGRFIAGFALDHFTPWMVATAIMGLPAIGLALLASGFDGYAVVMLSVLLIGLSFGGEGDLIGFMVVRNFGVRIFSSVMGMMVAIISISAATGAALVSLSLKATGGYAAFLIGCSIACVIGSLLFALLPRQPYVEPASPVS